jgi:predicted amidohydrolase YtcJ
LDRSAAAIIAKAVERGDLPQHIVALGLEAPLPQLPAGPWKIVLDESALPGLDHLAEEIQEVHASGRPVAIHVVTRAALLLALSALDRAGPTDGDRLEHAAVTPAAALPRLAATGLRIITQPTFVRQRGDDYLRDVHPSDIPDLYRYASLLAAGVRAAPSSDAPYGDLDPWRAIAAAVGRLTERGETLGVVESVPAATVLAGYLARPEDPGGRTRAVAAGAPADLCLLHVPLEAALAAPDASLVRATLRGGSWI